MALIRTTICKINPLKQVSRRGMADYVTDFKQPTLSEMPVPHGSWQTLNSAKQRSNNLILFSGLAIFTGTFMFFVNSGIVNFGRGPMHLIGKNLDE